MMFSISVFIFIVTNRRNIWFQWKLSNSLYVDWNNVHALLQATAERDQSEDEVPSDVDLNDPYFAEELKKTGGSRQVTSGINLTFL